MIVFVINHNLKHILRTDIEKENGVEVIVNLK